MKRKSIAILLTIALAVTTTVSCKPLRASAAETSTGTVNTNDDDNEEKTYTYEDLTYKIIDGSITITDCDYSAENVVIPEEINGYKVEAIGDNAFYSSGNLISVSIPDTVKTIGNGAFADSLKLKSVKFSNSLISLGEGCFDVCRSLNNVILPNSLTYISDRAFLFCDRLNNITIPSSIKKIGNDAFACCGFYDLELPEGIESIGDSAFQECKFMTSVTLPNSLISLGNNAFCRCGRLDKFNIPSNLKDFGTNVLGECYDLNEFTVNVDNPYYSELNNVLYTRDMKELVYSSPASYDTLDIPHSCNTIKSYSFCNSRVSSVNISDLVSLIEDCAFCGADYLDNINIGKNVSRIGSTDFNNCEENLSITINKDNPYFSCKNNIIYNKDMTKLILCTNNTYGTFTVPNTVNEICDNAFDNTKFSDIIIPINVNKIGHRVFTNYSNYGYDLNLLIQNPNIELCDDFLDFINSSYITIKGYVPSTAKEYADKNRITFKDLSDVKDLIFENLKTIPEGSRIAGKNVKVEADATGEGPITYKFVVLKDNKAVYLRQYKEKNTMMWQPQEAGDYIIKCSAKDANGNIKTKTINYKVYKKAAISDVTASKQGAQKLGKSVKLTTTATGEGTLKYKYTIYKDGKYVTTIGYRFKNSCIWKPEERGYYEIKATVKDDLNSEDSQTLLYVIE